MSRRKSRRRSERRRGLVVTEGIVTEPQYLDLLKQKMPRDIAFFDVCPEGTDPLRVVKRAVNKQKMSDYDWIVCLVDCDEHRTFDEAFKLAEKHGIQVLVSNPCFEVWLLWHIEDFNSSAENSVIAFSEITEIPVTFYSADFGMQWEYGTERKVCTANKTYEIEGSSCRHNLTSSMKFALSLGEVYIFTCSAGLVNLAYPFADSKQLYGYFIAGPIAMGTSMDKAMFYFNERLSGADMNYPLLMSISSRMKL